MSEQEVLDAPSAEAAQGITEYTRVEAGLADLRSRYVGVVFDMKTVAGNDAARKARQEVIKTRSAVEAIRKAAKAPLLTKAKLLDEEARRITGELLAIETPIDEQIKADEARRAEERKAREAAEAARIAHITSKIDAIAAIPAGLIGKSSADIDFAGSTLFARNLEEEGFDELLPRARAAADLAIDQLRAMADDADRRELAERQAAEARAEAERLRAEFAERERAEQERIRLEREQREAAEVAALKAEQDRLAAERAELERLQAEQRQVEQARAHINGVYQLAGKLAGGTSEQMTIALQGLDSQPDLGSLNGELQSAIKSARLTLESMLDRARDAERAQAEAARAIAEAQAKANAERLEREAAESEARAKAEAEAQAERAAAAAAEAARKAMLNRAEQRALEMFELLGEISMKVEDLDEILPAGGYERLAEIMSFVRGEA